MPCVSECGCQAAHRPRGNQRESAETTDFTRALDAEREEYDCRRDDGVRGMRPRSGADGTDWKDSEELGAIMLQIKEITECPAEAVDIIVKT